MWAQLFWRRKDGFWNGFSIWCRKRRQIYWKDHRCRTQDEHFRWWQGIDFWRECQANLALRHLNHWLSVIRVLINGFDSLPPTRRFCLFLKGHILGHFNRIPCSEGVWGRLRPRSLCSIHLLHQKIRVREKLLTSFLYDVQFGRHFIEPFDFSFFSDTDSVSELCSCRIFLVAAVRMYCEEVPREGRTLHRHGIW